jgi:hypothetical protein
LQWKMNQLDNRLQWKMNTRRFNFSRSLNVYERM